MLRLAFATVISKLRAIAPDSCSIPSAKVRSPNPLRIHRVRSQIPVRVALSRAVDQNMAVSLVLRIISKRKESADSIGYISLLLLALGILT
jgi:hypothetical protein